MEAPSLGRVRLVVEAVDPLSRAGIVHHVAGRADIEILPMERVGESEVMVFVASVLNASVMVQLRRLAANSGRRVILVLESLGDIDLLAAIEIGVVSVLWRAEATAERLSQMVLAAAEGKSYFPSEVQTRLVGDVARLERDVLAPMGLNASGLDAREVDVLRFIAEGLDTSEIAQRVLYSERTVKGILHGVMTRLHLRNRSQAVAYAMRAGLF